MLRDELVERFGSELTPGEFPKAFEECVRLIGQLKRTGSVAGVKRTLNIPEERLTARTSKQEPEEEEFNEDMVDDDEDGNLRNSEKNTDQREDGKARIPYHSKEGGPIWEPFSPGVGVVLDGVAVANEGTARAA
jgi:hypothetical protein